MTESRISSEKSSPSPIEVILRWKSVVALTLIAAVTGAAIVSQLLPTAYGASSTLLIALRADNQSFDTVQASQAVARSYAEIIGSPNIAAEAAKELDPATSSSDIRSATSFEVLPETQLLKINASAPTPERAKLIADTYANVFIRHAKALETTTQASVSLADPAPLSGSPSQPRPRLYMAVAAILGFVLGCGLAMLRDRFDRRLRTLADVEHNFDVPVLARIPERRRSQESKQVLGEAYHVLRTNIRFANPGAHLASVAITSARKGEGKSTTATNLAIAAARARADVIVVEADLRQPDLQITLGADHTPGKAGFSEYLLQTHTLDECLVDTSQPSLKLMPAGHLPPSPAGLLESREASEFVSAIANAVDLAIFDCPPFEAGADASIISKGVDGVILVVDLKQSTVQSVKEALRQLSAVRAPVLGIVLNRDNSATPSKYGRYAAGDLQRVAQRQNRPAR